MEAHTVGAMLINSMVRRLFALLLAAAMLVPTGAFGAALHACRAMGQLQAKECCCAHAKSKANSTSPEIQADCCEVKQSTTHPAPLALAPSSQVLALASVPVETLVVSAEHSSEAEAFFAARARGPPARVPLFLKNCSLLI